MSYVYKGGEASSIMHNDLGGLQGGTTGQYYHLTAAEHAEFENLMSGNIDGGVPDSVYGGVFSIDGGGP